MNIFWNAALAIIRDFLSKISAYVGLFLIALIIVIGAIFIPSKNPQIDSNNNSENVIFKLLSEKDSLIYLNNYKDSVIKTWEDHAIRMKRIAGADDSTVNWTYKEKVINPIDTQNIFKNK